MEETNRLSRLAELKANVEAKVQRYAELESEIAPLAKEVRDMNNRISCFQMERIALVSELCKLRAEQIELNRASSPSAEQITKLLDHFFDGPFDSKSDAVDMWNIFARGVVWSPASLAHVKEYVESKPWGLSAENIPLLDIRTSIQ
jgi:hypothetical protein